MRGTLLAHRPAFGAGSRDGITMLVTISPEAIAMGIEFQEDFEPRHQGGIARGTLLSDSLLQEAGLWLPAGGGSPGAA